MRGFERICKAKLKLEEILQTMGSRKSTSRTTMMICSDRREEEEHRTYVIYEI